MADLEQNQARVLAALEALEAKVAALKSGNPLAEENTALKTQLAQLESKALALKVAGEEAVKDLEMALGDLAALKEAAHG